MDGMRDRWLGIIEQNKTLNSQNPDGTHVISFKVSPKEPGHYYLRLYSIFYWREYSRTTPDQCYYPSDTLALLCYRNRYNYNYDNDYSFMLLG